MPPSIQETGIQTLSPLIEFPPGRLAEPLEQASRRTLRSKTFALGGGEYRLDARLSAVHVPDDFAAWRAGTPTPLSNADPQWRFDNGEFFVDGAWYDLRVAADFAQTRYRARAGPGDITKVLEQIGNTPRAGMIFNPEIREGGKERWFPGIRPGMDLYLVAHAGSVHTNKIIRTPDVNLRSLTWLVSEMDMDHVYVNYDVKGNDNVDKADRPPGRADEARPRRNLVMDNTITQLGGSGLRFIEKWTGETMRVDPVTRVKTPSPEHLFPVFIDDTTGELTIGANADDGKLQTEFTDTFKTTNLNMAGTKYFGIWRFLSVGIPAGSTITSANFITELTTSDCSAKCAFFCHDVDDATAWANSEEISAAERAPTDANTPWTTTGAVGDKTFDLVDEVGERQRLLGSMGGRALEQIEQGKQQQHDHEPQRGIAAEIQIPKPFLGATASCGASRLNPLRCDASIGPAQ